MKKYVLTSEEFLNEELTRLNENEEAETIKDLKKGDTCVRMMERDNPQLGVYYTFNKRTVKSIAGKSIKVTGGYGDDESYDLESGQQKKKSKDVYGSSWYTLITLKQAQVEMQKAKDGRGGKTPSNDLGFK